MRKFLYQWKSVIIFLPTISLFGFLLRVTRIVLYQQPIFADEAIYVRWAQVMRAEPTLRFLPLSDGKQPLFMWSMIPLLKLFSDPLIAGRMLSVICSLATGIGIFLLTYLLFKNKKVSLIATLLYALSPFAVFFDSMALVDSMLASFAVWTLYLGLLTAQKLRLDYAMLTGFALGGASLTKSPWIFFAGFLPLSAIFLGWPRRPGDKFKTLVTYALLLLVTFTLSLTIYNILRLGPNFHLISSRNADYVFPLSHFWTNPKDPFIFHFDRALEWIWGIGPWSVFLLFIGGVIINFKKYRKQVFILSVWSVLPILVQSEFAKVFTARYIYFSLPFIFILAASAFLSEKFKKLLNVILIIFIIHSLSINYVLSTNIERAPLPPGERSGYLEEWTAGTGIREAAEYLKEYARNNQDENIIVGTEGYFGTLPDGLQLYLNKNPEITVIGVGINLKEIPDSLLESQKSGNTTFMVINNSRFSFDPLEKGLETVAVYPKAFRRTDAHEYTLYGPQETLYLFRLREKDDKSI